MMRSRISTKLMGAVGLSAAVVTSVAVYLMVSAYNRLAVSDAEAFAQQLSETVKSSTRYDMLLNQRESIHQIISTVGQQEGIDKVRIYNKEGEIILSTDSADVGQLVDMNAEACYACHAADQPLENLSIRERTRIFEMNGHGRMLGIINPIYNEPSCWQASCHAHGPEQTVLGVLDITVPLGAADRQQRESGMQLMLLMVAAVIGISLIIYFLVKRLVLKPVALLSEATESLASGDLQTRVPVGSDDEIGRLAASFNDMTGRLAEAQRQLFRQDKLASVGRLAAGVAHEINNPLTGVLTYASFLQSKAADQPELKEDLDVIVRETKRCRDIVKGLLDFSRQSVPEKHHVHVSEIVHRSGSIVRNQFSLHRIRLVLDMQEDLPAVHADANQIQQVLVNLLVNSADALGKTGGTVTIQTRAAPEGTLGEPAVQIVVRDTGKGIAPDDLSKIWDPFFTTKGQQGNGLGLAIVWGIIETHHGRIEVESEEGVGTAFTVTLPVVGEQPSAPLIREVA
jgi:two-component system NtrC family sensor kinase